ncbi:hypothetical protein [Streptomyces sp. NPDC054961]
MSGEGGEGGTDGGDAAADVGVEAQEPVETTEDAYLSQAPEDDPNAFWNHMEPMDPPRYESNATPDTDEEAEARRRRELAAAERGLLPVQMMMRAREARRGEADESEVGDDDGDDGGSEGGGTS